jgi:hypothetical protein
MQGGVSILSRNSNVARYKYQENSKWHSKMQHAQKPQQSLFWLLRQLNFYAFFEQFCSPDIDLKLKRFLLFSLLLLIWARNWIETAANFGEQRRRLRLLMLSRLQTHLRRKGHDWVKLREAEVDNSSLPNRQNCFADRIWPKYIKCRNRTIFKKCSKSAFVLNRYLF